MGLRSRWGFGHVVFGWAYDRREALGMESFGHTIAMTLWAWRLWMGLRSRRGMGPLYASVAVAFTFHHENGIPSLVFHL
ncbi:unnamed protein product [Toxocara canis]|uniref:Inner membrane protein n=1 Tax=Toxocara canis TaxID=6265 RepID=A0A183V242_TOXCA|nr:unnamed protein product [Toxocara canis]